MKPFDLAEAAFAPARAQQVQAEIEFAREPAGATYIRRQRVGYPFHLGRTLVSPGDPAGMPTVYLQSCAGGIFEGDDLRARIEAGEGSCAHVTSGAATIAHSMTGKGAAQQVELHAREGSFLEYLPDPTILFPRSRLANKVSLRLHPDATVILGDALLLHDPHGNGELFTLLQSETRIEDESGRLLVCDRFRIEGRDLARGLAGINGNFTAQGTLFALAPAGSATQLMAAMRDALAAIPDAGIPCIYAGVSLLPGSAGAWMRLLARDAIGLRAGLHAAWAAVRRQLTGSVPMPRRK